MTIFGDFFDAAQQKVTELQTRYLSRPTDTTSTIGSSIFNALYQYGAGKVDAARASLVTGALASSEGKKFVAEAEKQRLQAWLPWIIGATILILGAGFLAGRR